MNSTSNDDPHSIKFKPLKFVCGICLLWWTWIDLDRRRSIALFISIEFAIAHKFVFLVCLCVVVITTVSNAQLFLLLFYWLARQSVLYPILLGVIFHSRGERDEEVLPKNENWVHKFFSFRLNRLITHVVSCFPFEWCHHLFGADFHFL